MFSPAALECCLLSVTHLHDMHGKPTNSYLVLGQVIGVHIKRKFITSEGLFDTAAANPIARCGYLGDYTEVTHIFQMRRPPSNDAKLLEDVQRVTNEDMDKHQ
jgi:flavin reductase (DIM6/NTAB) family NADH-FMN oxidoreductase RutF